MTLRRIKKSPCPNWWLGKVDRFSDFVRLSDRICVHTFYMHHGFNFPGNLREVRLSLLPRFVGKKLNTIHAAYIRLPCEIQEIFSCSIAPYNKNSHNINKRKLLLISNDYIQQQKLPMVNKKASLPYTFIELINVVPVVVFVRTA